MNFVRTLTLRQLQVFIQVAQHRSIVRAAQALHLSQPAVSMQIKQLETVTEQPLFERTRQGLTLTQAGTILLHHAHRILGEVKDAQESVEALTSLKRGTITLGMVSTAKYFCPRLIAKFRQSHPDIQVKFAEGNRETLIGLLGDNAIDLAVMGRPPRELDAVSEPLAANPHLVVAAPGHPLEDARDFDMHELRNDTFLLREIGSGTRNVAESMLKNHLFEPYDIVTLGSNESVKQAVMAGLGVSVLSLHSLQLELRMRRLCILDVNGTPIERVWHLVHMVRKHLSPAAQAFRRFMLENAASFLEQEFAQTAHPQRAS